MANPDEKTNGAMKAFIVVMVLMALGLGGALYWNVIGFTDHSKLYSLEQTQVRYKERISMLREIEEYRAPSVLNALEIDNKAVSEETIKATKETVRILIAGLVDEKNLSGVGDASPKTANPREEFQPWDLRVELKEISKEMVVAVLQAVVAKTGKYATISDLKLEATRLKEADLAGSIDPNTFFWDLDFKLTWFQLNPKYKPAETTTTSPPGT